MNSSNHSLEKTDSLWQFWKNPIFCRYCRSRLRPKALAIALLIPLLIAGFISGMAHSFGIRADLNSADAARAAIIPLLVLQSVILFIFGTAMVSGGMTAERDEGVIDYQRLIPISPLTKIFGYLFGLPIREYLMFLITVPFTVWSLWVGQVKVTDWLPLYFVLFSSTLLYHFTGLVTGTVAKNRRWAFLSSIGIVFSLYTIIPQMANFGLVFFKYLTIRPVFEESLSGLLPTTSGSVIRISQSLVPTVKFFGLNFSEAVFTIFSQLGFILTFISMLSRRWKKNESHLLGKIWGTGFFVWIQVLLLGNALPLIDPGTLFPSRGLTKFLRQSSEWDIAPNEAVIISGIYGLFTMFLILVLGSIIAPTPETQIREWRRARKQGASRLAWAGDAAPSFCFITLMALTGAASWYIFTKALVESRWFPGHEVHFSVSFFFAAILFFVSVGSILMIEWKGMRSFFLSILLLCIVPIMAGSVLSVASETMIPFAIWIAGISPFTWPFYASGTLLSLSELPIEASRAVPRAFHFYLFVSSFFIVWIISRVRIHQKSL